MDITSAAIATVLSTTISTLVNLLIARNNKLKSFDDQLDSLLKIAIQYPYLEGHDFTKSWNSKYDRNDEKYLRYEVYATMVFNFLSRFCGYYKYNSEKIEKYIAVKDWVRLHDKYWRDPTVPHENTDTYDKEFVELVEKYLR